jgi:predicted dienelactone hydrolase
MAGGVAWLQMMPQEAQTIATDPMNAVDRCKDVSFAIDQLGIETHDRSGKSALNGSRLDLSTSIGMAGHSFGANTTMLIAGELTKAGKTTLADDAHQMRDRDVAADRHAPRRHGTRSTPR